MSLLQTSTLLSRVTEIQRKHTEIARITGSLFNVFDVLRLSTSETRTHSAFLAYFLNPRESHGQGALFLNLFMGQLRRSMKSADESQATDYKGNENGQGQSVLMNFEIDQKCQVQVEYYAGPIENEIQNGGPKGGRIDILLRDCKNRYIVIENKINALDQENQLVRYRNSIPNQHLLLYLTLDGKEPSEFSKGKGEMGLKVRDYYPISYREMVLPWLESCRAQAMELPTLRETLGQYIALIKRLTGQNPNQKMNQEIVNLILEDAKNLDAAFAIEEALPNVKKRLALQIFESLKLEARQADYNCVSIKEPNIRLETGEAWGAEISDHILIEVKEYQYFDFLFRYHSKGEANWSYLGLMAKKDVRGNTPEDVKDSVYKLFEGDSGNIAWARGDNRFGSIKLFPSSNQVWTKEDYVSAISGQLAKQIMQGIKEMAERIDLAQIVV